MTLRRRLVDWSLTAVLIIVPALVRPAATWFVAWLSPSTDARTVDPSFAARAVDNVDRTAKTSTPPVTPTPFTT